tara:strand:+ start:136 stop:486 length:351 start_codon:yes stop_codon:yes gene_type:complete
MIKIDTVPGGILSACFTLLYLSVAYIFFDITELDRGNAWIEFLTFGLCGLIGTISTLIIFFIYRNLFPDLKYNVRKLIKSKETSYRTLRYICVMLIALTVYVYYHLGLLQMLISQS